MSERKTSDAEIQRIVRYVKYPTQEVFLRQEARAWNEADFLYALDRIDSDLADQPNEARELVRVLYRTLRKDREEAEARMALESANIQRHAEISRRLEELKKPHWSIIPNFWMTLIILILTAIGAVATVLALRH